VFKLAANWQDGCGPIVDCPEECAMAGIESVKKNAAAVVDENS
jgi:hypothetical protein